MQTTDDRLSVNLSLSTRALTILHTNTRHRRRGQSRVPHIITPTLAASTAKPRRPATAVTALMARLLPHHPLSRRLRSLTKATRRVARRVRWRTVLPRARIRRMACPAVTVALATITHRAHRDRTLRRASDARDMVIRVLRPKRTDMDTHLRSARSPSEKVPRHLLRGHKRYIHAFFCKYTTRWS